MTPLSETLRQMRRKARLAGKTDLRGCVGCKKKLLDKAKAEPTSKATLSLCINTRNEGPDVLQTIISVRNAYSGPLEVIIVADETEDGSCDGLEEKSKALNATIKVLRNEKAVGCGKAKTQAVNAATGDVILHMDGHCRVLKGSLDPLVERCVQEDCIVSPADTPLHGPRDGQPAPDAPYNKAHTSYGGFIRLGRSKDKKTVRPMYKVDSKFCWKDKSEVFRRRTATWFAIFAISKGALKKIGGWNEYPGLWGSQEIGLALRAWFADVPIYAMRGLVCGHRYQDDRAHKDYQKVLKEKGIKHYPTKARQSAANSMYAHMVVFSQHTTQIMLPLWRERYGEKRYTEAAALLDESKVAEQADRFHRHCKKKTDEEFFAEFGYPPGYAEAIQDTPVEVIEELLPCNDITAVVLNYMRPVNVQRCVDGLRNNGIKNIWVWCNANAPAPEGVTRVFQDSENGLTWPRYCIGPLVPTRYVLLIDDDAELNARGVEALRRGATWYPDRVIGLFGARFKAPYDSYNRREYSWSHEITEPTEVDMLWPKGTLYPREVMQQVFARADLWQRMREECLGETRGDDLIAFIAQQLEGLPAPIVMPTNGKGVIEHPREARKSSLANRPSYKGKRKTLPIWREMGWRALEEVGLSAKGPAPVIRGPKTLPQDNPGGPLGTGYSQRSAQFIEMTGGWIKQEPTEAGRMFDLLKKNPPEVYIEIGSECGGTLFAFAAACEPGATLIAVDDGARRPQRDYMKKTIALLKQEGYDVHWVRGNSHKKETLKKVKKLLKGRQADFLFVDGDHHAKGVLADWKDYGPLVKDDHMIAFHDIAEACGSSKVNEAWPEIKEAGEDSVEFIGGKMPYGRSKTKTKLLGIGVIWK